MRKTTSIGNRLTDSAGKKVVLWRPIPSVQLLWINVWSERAQVDIVSKGMNTDPSAVAFETLQRH